ncbi:MAG: thioredoxin [Candidatus Nanoarchaeia archaeon]
MATNLNENSFRDFVKSEWVVIDFSAESWCNPCKLLAPVFEEVSKELTSMQFGKVDVDDEAELASEFSVMSVPTIVVFHKGQEKGRVNGFMPKAVLKAKINDIVKA